VRALVQQHSFLIAAVPAVVGLGLFLLGTGLRPWRVAAAVAVVAALGGFYVLLRTGPSAADGARVEQAIRGGAPVLVEVYSDF
jgi:fructose-1,6-bisphosphatase/inositol monophosphatase family enzyme